MENRRTVAVLQPITELLLGLVNAPKSSRPLALNHCWKHRFPKEGAVFGERKWLGLEVSPDYLLCSFQTPLQEKITKHIVFP